MLDRTSGSVKRISVSLLQSSNAAAHNSFKPQTVSSVHELADIITSEAWSPILWSSGKRAKSNFLSADFVGLDIDEGFDLSSCLRWLDEKDFGAIIALSKSHQKEKATPGGKVSPPCDRYRVVIPAETEINNLAQYEMNMKWWHSQLPIDPSCHDGGRFFFSSPTIFHIREGAMYKWQNMEKQIAASDAAQRRRLRANKSYFAAGALPPKIDDLIRNGSEVGSRHKSCYFVGAALAEMGFDASSTIRFIMAGPLGDIGEHDVTRAVANARTKIKGGK